MLALQGCQCLQPTVECSGSTCLPLEEWCRQKIPASRCANLKACGLAADVACEAILPWPTFATSEPCPTLLFEAVDAGRVSYDEAAASLCLRGLATQCWYSPPGCDRVLVGTRAAGEACRLNAECQPGTWCNLEGCPGTCRSQRPAGAEVTAPQACGTAYSEFLSTGKYVCREYAQLGEACDAAQRCAEGLRCGGDGGCEPTPPDAGVRSFAGRGEPCTASGQAGPVIACLRGLACHGNGNPAGLCGSLLTVGESCSADALGCVQNAICESGTCVSLGGVGAPCSAAFDCLLGLGCREGQCGEKGPPGASCTRDFDCQPQLRCEQGHCAVPSCLP